MDAPLKHFMRALGLGEQIDRLEAGLCPLCGEAVDREEFASELEVREYGISGMCAKCQRVVFTEEYWT